MAIAHPNEIASRALAAIADAVVETTSDAALAKLLTCIGKL